MQERTETGHSIPFRFQMKITETVRRINDPAVDDEPKVDSSAMPCHVKMVVISGCTMTPGYLQAIFTTERYADTNSMELSPVGDGE